jgi:2-keto-4-pentenoate hydratase/2-oxohepta-3-ene-1,7-dioic acid hydratase in catechol pathway
MELIMKFIRFEKDNGILNGVLEGNEITVIKGSVFEEIERTDEKVLIDDVKILPPCLPSKAVCIGLNYKTHVEESGVNIPESPVVFMKPSTAVIGNLDYIIYPQMSKRVDYEAELAVVIGKKTKNITVAEAKDAILGYTCGNDVSARDLQPENGQWTIAKSFDTFLPLGPWIETDADPSNLRIRTLLNGEVKQDSNTKFLIFDVYTLVSYISQIMTLNPGDVIMTGTPRGIAPMKKGDKVEVEIENIGTLTNFIK